MDDNKALEKFEKTPIDRIYETSAYDRLEDAYKSGFNENFMADKFDRQQMVNFLIPIIRKEERERHLSPSAEGADNKNLSKENNG